MALKNIVNPANGLTQEEEDYSKTENRGSFLKNIQYDPIGENIYGGGDIGTYSKDSQLNFREARNNPEDIYYQRADIQTGWELLGKSLGQAATEATLGAIESVGYALDFEDLFNTDNLAERDFDNWFSKPIREFKESIYDETIPIYKTKDAESGTLGQKLGDATYWAGLGQQAGIVGSMMIPSMAVGAFTANLLSKASMAARAVQGVAGLTAGLTSAKIEATMEASQGFQDNYNKFMNDPKLIEQSLSTYKKEYDQIANEYESLSKELYNPTNEDYQILEGQRQERLSQLDNMMNQIETESKSSLDKMARERAGIAASIIYKANAIKAPLEVAQYMIGLKSFGKIKGGLMAVTESKVGKVANIAFQPASEGFEEVYQGFAQTEATRSASGEGQIFDDELGSRFKEYATSEEGKEAAFLGAFMGGVFEMGSKYGGKVINNITETVKKQTSDKTLTEPELKKINDIHNVNSLINAYSENDGINKMNSLMDITSRAHEDILNDQELSDEDRNQAEETFNKMKETSSFITNKDIELSQDPRFANQQLRGMYVKAQLTDKLYEDDAIAMSQYMTERLSTSGLDSKHIGIYENMVSIENYKEVQKELLSDNNLTKSQKDAIKSHIAEMTSELKSKNVELIKEAKESNPKFNEKKLAPRDSKEISKYNKNKLLSETYREAVTKPMINEFDNLKQENIQDVVNQISKNDDDMVYEQSKVAISNINNIVEFEAKIDQLKQNNPIIAFSLKNEIEAKRAELSQKNDISNIDSKQRANFDKLYKKIDTLYGEELINAKEELNKDGKNSVNNEHKKILIEKIDNKMSEFRKINEDKIRSEINNVKSEKSDILNNVSRIKDTVSYLEELLGESSENNKRAIDSAFKELKNLGSLIKTNSKKKTKYGKNVQNKIESIGELIKDEYSLLNDIQNRVNELNEVINQSESIVNDLDAKINYYNNLISNKNFRLLSESELLSKIENLSEKRSILSKLIERLKTILNRTKDYLKEFIGLANQSINSLDKFIIVNDFSELTTEEIKSRIASGSIDNYAKLKEEYDKLVKNVNNSIDGVEVVEESSAKEEAEIAKLNEKITIIDNNIRYIEDLFELFNQKLDDKKEDISKKDEISDKKLEKKPEALETPESVKIKINKDQKAGQIFEAKLSKNGENYVVNNGKTKTSYKKENVELVEDNIGDVIPEDVNPSLLVNISELTPEEQIVSSQTEDVVDKESPIITQKMIDDVEESETSVDGSDRTGLFEVEPRILLTTKSKEAVQYKNSKGNTQFQDKYDASGNLIKTPLYDPKHAAKESFVENSTVVVSVNEQYIQVKGNKKHVVIDGKDRGVLSYKNIPISVQTLEDFNENKAPFIAIRDLAEDKWENLNEDAKAKTETLRQDVFDGYSIGVTTFNTTVTSKDGGWLNRTKRAKDLSINLKVDDSETKYGIVVEIGTSDRSNVIETPTGDAINTGKIPAGLAFVVVENAKGEKIGSLLKQTPLSEQITPSGESTETYANYVSNVFSIIEAYADNDVRFTYNNIYKEVGKYFNLRKETKGLEETVNPNDNNLNNNVFSLLKDKNGSVVVSLPNKKGFVRVVIKKGQEGLEYYRTQNGKEVLSTKDNLFKEFNNRLDQMYANINKSSNADIYNFKRYKVVDGKLEEVSENYIDFLSNAGIKTRVVPMIGSDSNPYYVTQPNITIDENLRSFEENNKLEELPKQDNSDFVLDMKDDGLSFLDGLVTAPIEDEFTLDNVIDIDEDNSDFDDIDLLSEDVNETIDGIEYNNTSLSSFSNMSDIQKEYSLINSMLEIFLQKLDSKRINGAQATPQEILGEVKKTLENSRDNFAKFSKENISKELAKENKVTTNAKTNLTISKNINFFLENFDQKLNQDGSVKFVGYANLIMMSYRKLPYDSAYIIDEDLNEDESTNPMDYVNNKNFKTDPEKSLSAQIKRTLSNVKKLNSKGKYQVNSFGMIENEDFGKVFNYLMENLSDIDINDIVSELSNLATVNNIAKEVEAKLNELRVKNPEVITRFTTVFKKQKTMFNSLIYEEKGDSIVGKVSETNRSGAKDVIFSKWNETYLFNGNKSELLKEVDSKITINKKIANELDSEFVALQNLSGDEYLDGLKEVFNKIGINVSLDALKLLRSDFSNKNHKKYFKKEFKGKAFDKPTFTAFINAYYGPLFYSLKNGVNIFEDGKTKIKNLALYEQKFDVDASSQSFRAAGGEMYYAFVNSHHLSNTINKINNGDKTYNDQKLSNPFSKYSTWINNPESVNLRYIDASKNSVKGSIAKSYEEQNKVEKEVTKVNFFLNNNNLNRALTFTIAPSDKTTFALLDVLKLQIPDNLYVDSNLTLSDDLNKQLLDLLVMSEVERINQTIDDFKNKDKKDLLEGYHYDAKTNKVGSGAYFFFIPQLNEVIARDKSGKIILSTENISTAKDIMTQFLESEIASKVELWKDISLRDKVDTKGFGQKGSSLDNLATDFVINNAVSYANQFMMVSGDPALFAKIDKGFNGKFEEWNKVIDSSMINLFKRTAKDIAPSMKGLFDDKTYKVLFINEPTENSVLGKEISSYLNIKLADAQEWTTLEEHLKVMKAFGKIDQSQYDNILENKDNLTYEQILTVMQPMKPVQVLSQMGKNFNAETEYYIKTSSYPLLSQLTKGFPELNKMRKFMETNKVDRIVPKSAVKLGFHNAVTLFDDGVFNENTFDGTTLTLSRDGFGIQQEVPYDETKAKILEGSQLRRMLFSDLDPTWDFNGKTGLELKQLSDRIHTKFYERNLEKFKESLDVNEDGIIRDMDKLKDMMIKEGIDRKYSINDLLSMTTKKLSNGQSVFNIPLFFHPMVHKVESLLNSLIKNKVLKLKLPGKSFVQGSALGYKVASEDFLKLVNKDNNGVILTKDYKGSLDYRKDNDGLFAEVLMPSMFKNVIEKIDKNGKKIKETVNIDLTQFVNKDGFLDTSRIDKDLLTAIGYRIPTQGFSSMVRLKIVGILPKMSGDLIIVPAAMTVQMGSDFDVDKLYVHTYNHYLDPNTNKIKKVKYKSKIDTETIKKLSGVNDYMLHTDEELQNELLDIYNSVLKNEEVQKLSKKPLDNTKIEKLVNGDLKINSEFKSLLSDQLHSDMVESQASGQIGVGISSTWVTGHIADEYAGTYIKPKIVNKKVIYNSVMFSETNDDKNIAKFNDHNNIGENTVNKSNEYGSHSYNGAFRLDKINGFDGRKITDVLVNIQTESVDNANNGKLYPMNLNKYTFDVGLLIGSAGFNEEFIGYFLNQPAIKDYVSELQKLDSFTDTEFVKDKKDKLKQSMLDLFEDKTILDELATENVSLEDMKKNLTEADKAVQLKVLKNFFVYEELAGEMKTIRGALNVDTKFLGSNFAGVVNRKSSFSKKLNSKLIGNTLNLYNNTIAGAAYDNGVLGALDLFGTKNLLPYDSKVMQSIFNNISEITDRDLTDKDTESITIDIRSSLHGEALRQTLGILDLYKYRKALLFGQNNLAKRVYEARELMKTNKFLQSLEPKISYDSKVPSTIEHYSSKDAKAEYDFQKQIDWLKLINSDDLKVRQLGLDLVFYATSFGTERNAKDFGRFIPIDFVINSGLAEKLSSIDFSNINNVYTNKLSDNFIQQYFQHNPGKLQMMPADLKGDLPEYVRKYNKDSKKVEVYRNIDDKYVKLDSLGEDFQSEYDLDLEYTKTIFPNNPIGAKFTNLRTVDPKNGVVKDINSGKDILNNYDFNGGVNSVLSKIKESNSRFSKLASYYSDNSDKVSDYTLERLDFNDPIHKVNKDEFNSIRGRLITGTNKLILVNETLVDFDERFQRTFLHELTHAFTVETLDTPDSALNEQQIKAKQNLQTLFEDFNKQVTRDKRSFGNAQLNLKEFVAEVMVSQNLQDYLESKSYKDKSLMQRFIELVQDLFGVKNDTMLEAAMSNIIGLAELKTDSNLSNSVINEPVINNNLNSKFKDISLTKSYKSIIDSWSVYGSKFEADNITKDSLKDMSPEQLGSLIKKYIC